jgi:O-glycosyl hydrolase
MRLGNICVSSIIAGSSASDIKVQVRNKCLSVFQKIDMFGYMTNTSWLMDENVKRLKIFYGKLAIQWNLDFGLNNTARYKISRTHNLFSNLQDIILSRADKYVLLDKILDTLNILVSNGESDADRNTGCILILYALASINPGCIEANPWLA